MADSRAAIPLKERPVHLGRGGAATVEPAFTGEPAWYAAYAERHVADGVDGRLVSLFTFTQNWDSWEMHPAGAELVLCTAGRMTLLQEQGDGRVERVVLGPGDYAINAPGTWHSADVAGEATALFITSGLGTRTRPR